MKINTSVTDFLPLFLNDVPLLDVRAPVEFNKGAFPASANRPLLNDEQRELIGTEYQRAGQNAAIELGNSLATDPIKQQRIDSWQEFFVAPTNRSPNYSNHHNILYCFRGGLRSKISQQWLAEAGTSCAIIAGGYKALRRYLIDQIDSISTAYPARVLSGRTGSGKTIVIRQLPNGLDLEGIANHRGSSFGRQLKEQPTQIAFENKLAISLLKLIHTRKVEDLVMEDEAHLIGRCALPKIIHQKVKNSPIVLLKEPQGKRVTRIHQEYIKETLTHYKTAFGDKAETKLGNDLLTQLDRIKKRLGGDRYKTATSLFTFAHKQLITSNDSNAYQDCIDFLLTHYYDPMYDYQLKRKQANIEFTGDFQQVTEYLSAAEKVTT